MSAARLLGLAAIGAGAVLSALAGPAEIRAQGTAARETVPDSFYLSLLRDGRSEMVRGDAVAAKKSFRLACFGFLEQPVLLAEGLVRLGLAEAALADREAFATTFSRLAEVEEQFAAYAPAALSADERRSFEDKAFEWVAPETLRAFPGFAPRLALRNESALARLAPRERARELEKRAAAEPAVARWKVLLAQDDAASDRMAKALARLDGVPDAAEEGSAGCLRGRALARLKRCEEALVPLAACATVTSDALLAEAQLTCLLTLERPDAARQFAARIVPPAAEAPAVRKAVARLAAPEPKQGSARDPAPPLAREPAAAPQKAAPATAVPATAALTITAEEERAVAAARGLLKTGEKRAELLRGLALVRPVADRLPGRADLQLLAGEIAYRAGQWATGAEYFWRSTPDRGGPIDPTQRFYLAVCLFEAGDFAGAAGVAAHGLEKLQRPPFVEGYLAKIRAARP